MLNSNIQKTWIWVGIQQQTLEPSNKIIRINSKKEEKFTSGIILIQVTVRFFYSWCRIWSKLKKKYDCNPLLLESRTWIIRLNVWTHEKSCLEIRRKVQSQNSLVCLISKMRACQNTTKMRHFQTLQIFQSKTKRYSTSLCSRREIFKKFLKVPGQIWTAKIFANSRQLPFLHKEKPPAANNSSRKFLEKCYY